MEESKGIYTDKHLDDVNTYFELKKSFRVKKGEQAKNNANQPPSQNIQTIPLRSPVHPNSF